MSRYHRSQFDDPTDRSRSYWDQDRSGRRVPSRNQDDDRGPEMSRDSGRGSDTHESDERFGRREQYDPYFDEPGSRFGGREPGRERSGDFESFEDWQRPRQLGAQGNHAGRGPKGYQRSDERLKEDICDRLTDDPFVDASEIEVAVSSGEVTFSGSVRDRAMKRAAEDCIECVSGVSQLHNQLRVERRDEPGEGREADRFASARNQEGQRSSAGKKAH